MNNQLNAAQEANCACGNPLCTCTTCTCSPCTCGTSLPNEGCGCGAK